MRHHDDVLARLRAVAPEDSALGERIRADRGSKLAYLGLRTPLRRQLVKTGFAFYDHSDEDILTIWNDIWQATEYGDVLFAALDYYRDGLKIASTNGFWSIAMTWIERVDNWAHADDLARVYSRALATNTHVVHPQLVEWNALESLWHRRVSIVSLVHYSGKNAVFMTPDRVFPLLENCVDDHRPEIQKAIGWVSREMSMVYPSETTRFLDQFGNKLTTAALRRARSAR